jgi:AcrR family transcriptional regulator
MPRAFSTKERQALRAALLDQGRLLFAAHGLRKTSVEELAAAVGISKGAFYLFFESKEELYFELLETFEASYKAAMLAQIARSDLAPRERLRTLLERALADWKRLALFARFGQGEYEALLRRLAPERVEAHLRGDAEFATTFAAAWEQAGAALAAGPELINGMIRALFFVSLHEHEFEAGSYPAVIATLIDMTVDRLLPAGRGAPPADARSPHGE